MIYRLSWFLARILIFPFYRVRVEGGHNLPRQGGVILAANHASDFDPIFVGAAVYRQVYFMAKVELFRLRPVAWFLRKLGAFPVRRGMADRQAIKQALEHLKHGRVLGIFPEGTRSRTGELLSPKAGIGLLALRARVPVVPVGIKGNEHLSFRHLFSPPRTVEVRIGSPLDPRAIAGDLPEKEAMEKISQVVMAEIQRLRQ